MCDSIKSGRLQASGPDFRDENTLSGLIQYLKSSQRLALVGCPKVLEDGRVLISFSSDDGLPETETIRLLSQQKHEINGHEVILSAPFESCKPSHTRSTSSVSPTAFQIPSLGRGRGRGIWGVPPQNISTVGPRLVAPQGLTSLQATDRKQYCPGELPTGGEGSTAYESQKKVPIEGPNVIRIRGLPEDASREQVKTLILQSVKATKSVNINLLIVRWAQDDVRIYFEDIQAVTSLWRSRHMRPLKYDSHILSWDVMVAEMYEDDRFLVGNLPHDISKYSLSLHLKAASCLQLADVEVTPIFFSDKQETVVFLTDSIVDERLLEDLSNEVGIYESADGSGTTLSFKMVPQSRTVELSGLDPSVHKGTIRNYFQVLQQTITSTAQPLLIEEIAIASEGLPEGRALVKFRTVEAASSIIQLSHLPEIGEQKTHPEASLHHKYPSSAFDIFPADESGKNNEVEKIENKEYTPESSDVLEYVFQNEKHKKKLLSALRCNDVLSDGSTLTIIGSLEDADSCMRKAAEFFGGYITQTLKIRDARLWEESCELIESERENRGSQVKCYPLKDEIAFKFVGPESDLQGLLQFCANVISTKRTKLEEETKETRDTLSCASVHHFQLLEGSDIYKSAISKCVIDHKKVDHSVVLTLIGPNTAVRAAKESLVEFIASFETVFVDLKTAVLQYLQKFGLHVLTQAYETAKIKAVPASIEDSGVRVVALVSTREEVVKITKDTFAIESVSDLEDEEIQTYLYSAAFAEYMKTLGGECSVLIQPSPGVLQELDRVVSVAVIGEKGSVRDSINSMSKHLADTVLYERCIRIDHLGSFRYIEKFSKPQLTQLETRFSQYRSGINVYRPSLSNDWRGSIVYKCTKAGVIELKKQVEPFAIPSKVDKTITRHGALKYFRSDWFETERSRLERKLELVIHLDFEEYSDENDLEVNTEAIVPVVIRPDVVVSNVSTMIAQFTSKKQPDKRVALFTGNICLHSADAIVNAANEDLAHGLGVAKEIVNSAGILVRRESDDYRKKHGKLKVGTAMHTSAGALTSTKYVIHTVGPQWPGRYHLLPGTFKKTQERLRAAVKSSLEIAQSLGCKSVCFPAISSGVFGCPSEFVAKHMVKASCDFLDNSDSSVIEEIHFILLEKDVDNVKCFTHELQTTPDLSFVPNSVKSSAPAFPEFLMSTSSTTFATSKADRRDCVLDASKRKKLEVATPIAVKTTVASGVRSVNTTVVSGDITNSKTDAIVNSTNGSLELDSAQASKAVSKAAGPQLQLDCNDYIKNKGKLKAGDLAVTAGHKLPCKNVFHVVCPNSRKGIDDLVSKCLVEADRLGMKSVAFPALGTGNLGMSDADAAAGIFDGISTFSNRKLSSVTKVEVVIYDQAKLSKFQEEDQKRNSKDSASVSYDVRDDSIDNSIRLQNGLVVSLDNGDVAKSHSDVIVAPTGVVLGSVCKNAPKVNEELKTNCRGIPKPVADLSNGGVLACKRVFAIAVSSRGKSDNDTSIKCIRDVVRQCLDMANKRGCASICIPAIGTGGLGYSNVQSAAGIAEAAKDFSLNVTNPALKQIRVTVFDAHRISDFQKEIKSRLAGTQGSGLMSYVASGVTSTLKSVGAAVTSVFSIDERSENYSHAKKRTPVKKVPLTSFESGEADVVRMAVVGKALDVCNKAINSVEKSIEKYCITKKVPFEYEVPSGYADNLQKLAAQHQVALKLEIPDGPESSAMLTLAGYVDDVSEVEKCVLRLLHKAIKEEKDANDRDRILNSVVWYWRGDDGTTEPYTQDEIVKLELAFESDKKSLKLVQGSSRVEVDIRRMEQKSGSKTSKIVRKEKATGFQFPSTWTSTEGNHEYELYRHTLQQSDDEYKEVAKMFSDTGGQGSIVSIERVQNPRLYMNYIQEKQTLTKRRQKEIQAKSACVDRRLFHGTKPESVLHIVTCGFNRSYAGTAVGMMYGAGVYFANTARESCKYAVSPSDGNRQMLLCDVLLGMSAVGQKGMLEPPVINSSSSATDRYDSTVNNISNPTIFVSCYRDNMAYPTYVISFK